MPILWEIRLLGDLRVTNGDGGPNLAPFERKNAAVLLAYLACAAGRPQHREELAYLLWPEASTPKGRQNLNGELSHLRAELNAGGIPAESALRADRDFVSLPTEAARVDVCEFEAACDRADRAADEGERVAHLLSAFEAYGGAFLKHCDLFWAAAQRERLADRYLAAVEQLRGLLSLRGEHGRAISCARRAIDLHPDREEPRVTLVRLLRDAGRAGEARSECRRWRDRLRAHGDLEPGDEFLKIEGEQAPGEGPPAAARPPAFPPPLPAVFGEFVGRERERERLCGLILDPENRLVTLHGPGGSGKTRLAVETARLLRKSVQVWFVGLSGLDDARRIPERLLRDLGADPGAVSRTADPLDAVAAALEGEQTPLLVLDNFEHLAAHGGVLVRDLLEKAPALTCLVTSRQTLGLNAERQFPVMPLPVPDEAAPDDEWIPERLAQNPSAALFLDRARRRSPDFALTYENADAVAALCRHLEGLPLALELAASWVRVLTPRQMLTSFRRLLDLIPPEPEQPGGHRSLEATLWVSYNLLPDDRLRAFFARLSVFAGSWDDEATQAVAWDDGGPAANHLAVLTRLMHLCNASLLQSEEHRQGMRYRMLGLVRAFARERLNEGGGGDGVRERHRAFYRARAERAAEELEGWGQAECLDRWEHDLGNLRLTLADADPGDRLRLATGLHGFWEGRGLLQEGIAWLRDARDPGAPVPAAARLAALRVAAALADTVGDLDDAEALLAQGLRLCAAEADRAPFLLQQASLHLQRQRHPEARAASLAALNAARGSLAADGPHLSEYYAVRGYILKMQGHPRRARPYYERALRLGERHADVRPAWDASNRNNLGLLYEAEGRIAEAREYVESALEINRKLLGERHPTIAVRRNNLGRLLRQQGDLLLPEGSGEARRELWRQAREHHRAALGIYREFRPAAHLDVAMSRYYLGLTLHLLGEDAEARDVLAQAAPVLERKFGPAHPFVLRARELSGHPGIPGGA